MKRACPWLTTTIAPAPAPAKKKSQTSSFLLSLVVLVFVGLCMRWHFLCSTTRTHPATTTRWIAASMWGTHLSRWRLWRGSMLNAQSPVLCGGSNSSGNAPSSPTLNPNRSKFGFKTAGNIITSSIMQTFTPQTPKFTSFFKNKKNLFSHLATICFFLPQWKEREKLVFVLVPRFIQTHHPSTIFLKHFYR